MANSDPFVSMEGALWVLTDGPNSKPLYLGCHMVDDVTVPKGTNELMFCSDASGPNLYRTVGKIKGPPGLVTFTVEGDITPVIDYLETVSTGFSLLVTEMKSGRKDLVTNWDRAFIMTACDIVQENLTALVGKDENARSAQGLDIEAENLLRSYVLKSYRQSTTEAEALNGIVMCSTDCDKMMMVPDAPAAGNSTPWFLVNGTWTAAAADPFGADEHITASLCVPVDRDTNRYIVFRGVTDAANPAECAYTDDLGATWTAVDIGSTNGEFVSTPQAAFALDYHNIWVGTDGGYIFYSSDGGATWTAQESAVIHAADWAWIEFTDASNGFAGGDAGVSAITADGGETWSAATVVAAGAADITCGEMLSSTNTWIGLSNGALYYTNDNGTTWTLRKDFGTEKVADIAFINDHQGLLTHGTTSGAIELTKDGGYTWESITQPTNGGYNQLIFCTAQLAYAVGEVQGSTAVIAKLQPLS